LRSFSRLLRPVVERMPGRCVRVVLKLVALWMVCFLAVELYFTAFVKLQSNDGGPAVPQSEMVRHIVINNSDVRAASRSIKAPESLASRTTVNLHKVSDLSRRERSITSVKSGSESKQPNNRNSSTKPSKSRRQTELNDIFISVKTSKWYHDRLDLILETWYIMARDQVRYI